MHKEDYLALFTRIGFAARGVLYIMLGLLVIGTGRAEGADGVLRYLGGGAGKWLLIVMTLGFIAYGLWRLSDAILGTEHPGNGNKAIAHRVGAAASAAVHLLLAWQSAKLVMAAGSSSSGGSASGQAQTVLELPAGQILLGAIAVGLAVAGVMQLVKAAKCSFLADLALRAQDDWVKWLGRGGYAARGVVFLLGGWFLADAALSGNSQEAAGIEQILSWLSSPMNLLLAAGLFLFGLYGLVEARYRRIRTPDIDGIAAQVRT